MKIIEIGIGLLNVEMSKAIQTPIGDISAARNVAVQVQTDKGLHGWGEASPMPVITGDSQASCYALAKEMARLLLARDPLAIEDNTRALRSYCKDGPSIRSAFDMALHDISARQANMPLYRFLGGARRALITDMTIGVQDSAKATADFAQELVERGFKALKLKTGRADFVDIEHVAAAREAVGEDICIRIDSNQGWDYPQALANLRRLHAFNIEYSEQPLAAWNIQGHARLRKTSPIPLCADESLFDHHDALKLAQQDSVDYFNIKLAKSGGIATALKINAIAEAAGIKCMIGCFGESRLGLSAAAHLAMAKPNIHFIDLDSAYYFVEDPVIGGMSYKHNGPEIILPDTPGLGAEFDPDALEDFILIR